MKLFSFKRNSIKFYNFLKEIERIPYVVKYYKNDGTIIPALFFKVNSEILVLLFRYWRKEPGKVIRRIITENIVTKLWREGKISYYTPFLEYLEEIEENALKILVGKLKGAEDEKAKKEIKRRIMTLLARAGKRVGLHRIIIIKRL